MQHLLKNTAFRLVLGLALLSASWMGCQRDISVFEPEEITQAQLLSFLQTAPQAATKTVFTLNGLSKDTMLTTPGGVRVFLTDTDALFGNSSTVATPCSSCTDLRMEVTEVVKRGDMVARGLPSIGIDGAWLENAGAVLVEVFCNGQALKILNGRSIKIQLPAAATANDYEVYVAELDGQHLNGWKNTGQVVYQAEWLLPSGSQQEGFEILAAQTGWNSAQKTFSTTSNELCIDLPTYYNADNTLAFVMVDGRKVIAPLQPSIVGGQTVFCYDHVPAGYNVQIVVLTKVGDEYWLGYQKTESGTSSTFVVTPNKSTDGSVLDFLKNL
jgi:hypothetical protein